ncbi:hypothetical protein [Bacillus wiedmannii]
MIGMYKKINRVIEKEKGEFYVNKTYAETSRTIASPILLEAQTKTP